MKSCGDGVKSLTFYPHSLPSHTKLQLFQELELKVALKLSSADFAAGVPFAVKFS